ncbi:uncharacterized protein [Clytia hemisphaerica]
MQILLLCLLACCALVTGEVNFKVNDEIAPLDGKDSPLLLNDESADADDEEDETIENIVVTGPGSKDEEEQLDEKYELTPIQLNKVDDEEEDEEALVDNDKEGEEENEELYSDVEDEPLRDLTEVATQHHDAQQGSNEIPGGVVGNYEIPGDVPQGENENTEDGDDVENEEDEDLKDLTEVAPQHKDAQQGSRKIGVPQEENRNTEDEDEEDEEDENDEDDLDDEVIFEDEQSDPLFIPGVRIPPPRIPAPRIPAPRIRIPLPRIPAPRIPAPRIPAPRIPAPRIPAPRIPAPRIPRIPAPRIPRIPVPRIPRIPIPRIPRIPHIPGIPPIPSIPPPRLPGVPNIPGFPNPTGIFNKGIRVVSKGAKVAVGKFKHVKKVIRTVDKEFKKVDWKGVANQMGRYAKDTFTFLNCAFPQISSLISGCTRDLINSAASCKQKETCHIAFGGPSSTCLRFDRRQTYSKKYGAVTVSGVSNAHVGFGFKAYFNTGKIQIKFYGGIDLMPKIELKLNKNYKKNYKKRIDLIKRPVRIFKKIITIVIGNVPVPVIIEVTAQPVAEFKLNAQASGTFTAALTLQEAAKLALDHLTIEYDPSTGRPRVFARASQNLNNLKLKPILSLDATAQVTATFQIGVEIVFKINGIPFKTFPNFEVKLQGNAKLKANLGSQCVEGGLSLKTAFNLGVVPDIQALTSVADNFEAGCTGMVDNLCMMNPATTVLKCISSKADVCQYARNGCSEMAAQLAKIPNPIQDNPLKAVFKLFDGPSIPNLNLGGALKYCVPKNTNPTVPKNHITIKKNREFMTRSTLLRGYSLTFEIKPISVLPGWRSVLHGTIGGDHGKYGDRIPGIWFHHSTQHALWICSAVNGNSNRCVKTGQLPLSQYTQITVQQIQKVDLKYYYQIFVDSSKILDIVNNQPAVFNNVKYFVGDLWYEPSNAHLRNINLEMFPHNQGFSPVKRNTLLFTKPTLNRGWTLSLQIRPLGKCSGWCNIFHASIGSDNSAYGDRVPALWFWSGTTDLHICSAVSGNKDYCTRSKSLPINKDTLVVIQNVQSPKDFKYYYQVFVDGVLIRNVVNTDPRVFTNVKYYGSDNWHKNANAMIKNVKLEMHPHNLGYSTVRRNRLIRTVPILKRGWSLAMEIRPTGKVHGWSNIFHATIGRDGARVGDRIPGIWFHSNTNKLHVCTGIDHVANWCYNSPQLPLNYPSQLVVQQIQNPHDKKYYYSIMLNGKQVYIKVNHFPRIFHNVKYYLGDNWYNPAKAWVRKIRLEMY